MPTPINASEALREANATARTDVVEVLALEIDHPDVDGPMYVCSADEDVSITHEGPAGPFAYQAVPMKLDLPGQEEGRVTQATLQMDNVDRIFDTILDAVRLSDVAATVKTRIYLFPDLSAPAAGPFLLEVPNGNTSPSSARVVLTVPTIHLRKFPALDYSPQEYSTLVQ